MRELEALFQVAQAASRHEKVRELLEEIVEIARKAVPAAERSIVFLRVGPESTPSSAVLLSGEPGVLPAPDYRPSTDLLQAIEQGIPALIDDAGSEAASPAPRSALIAPLRVRDRPVGGIVLENLSRPRAFTQADLRLLNAIAASAALGMKRIRLFEETRRRADELAVLHAIAALGVTAEDEDLLIEQATAAIGQALYHENLGLLLLDPDRGVLHPHPSYRLLRHASAPVEIPLGTGITGKVAATAMPRRVGDVTKDPVHLMAVPEVRSEMCAPLRIGDRILGVIDVESVQPDAFSEEDERFLSTVASQLAAAIERVRSLQEARTRAENLAIFAQVETALRRPTTRAGTLAALAEQLHEVLKVSASA
ncbi:MAG: GAF domain-containing protein, partial [Chloroflexia bacterium]